MSIASYSFLPFMRQGIANSLESTGEARGSFTVTIEVHGDAIIKPAGEKKIEIYGPGDVIGIETKEIIKTDPHDTVNNFEPNYLAYIDFYDEDFPWRYTPVKASGQQLNPWIALVVLAEGEFDNGQNLLDRPLPFFTLKNAATLASFPKFNQLWAWAHVHYNGDLTASDSTIVTSNASEVDKAIDKLQLALNQNPDCAYSRLVCPRKLQPNTAYHAFVIPAYESGRLAGSGADAAAIAAAKLKIAWQDNNLEHPYYHRWKFNTGDTGDFEYLVELLKPRVADSRVGRRVMDMTQPGANLTWVEDTNPNNQLGGILRLGGALRVPEEALTDIEIAKTKKFDEWATRTAPNLHPFQAQVAGLLNLADDYNTLTAKDANAGIESGMPVDPNEDADPLVTPPIYGRWHAMVERVYKDRDGNRLDNNYNWLNELNLDPRFRVPAHFGTRVVQDNQEKFMEAAWEQIGEVISANRQIRFSQFSIAAGTALHSKHFVQANAVSDSKTLLLTAPIQKRILFDGVTVFNHLRQTVVPDVILSTPMRRIARPRGRTLNILQKQRPEVGRVTLDSIVTKISTGELLPSPPKGLPSGMPLADAVADLLEPSGIPAFLKAWLKKYPWLPNAVLALAVLVVFVLLLLILFSAPVVLVVLCLVAAVLLAYLWYILSKWKKDSQIADGFKTENKTPQSVDSVPNSPDFRLSDIDENFTPSTGGATDSAQAQSYKISLKDMYTLFQFTKDDNPAPPPPRPVRLPDLSLVILDKIRPEKTVPAWVWQQVFIPGWIRGGMEEETFTEAMAYPKINTPMYEPLKKISDELFLPNIELIEHNSITLLETNQHFIEAYMVGLNHEFARELLWREYPTDQRGSYFRQFWDPSVALPDPSLKDKTEDEKREPYYDIPKLHLWRRKSKLGDHDNRQKPGEPEKEEVVLVIRGELLKKYPTAVIYAHKAAWTNNDVHKARSLQNKEEGDKEHPDPQFVRLPLYHAKVDPDIYFFGFDLTVEEARGDVEPAQPTKDNAGWFFVIKERPGEPRFGLDADEADNPNPPLLSWNDLNWKKVLPGDGAIDVLGAAGKFALPATAPPGGNDEENGERDQYNDDIHVPWDTNIDAANLAYILYQVPVMVAVHASDMLLEKKKKN